MTLHALFAIGHLSAILLAVFFGVYACSLLFSGVSAKILGGIALAVALAILLGL